MVTRTRSQATGREERREAESGGQMGAACFTPRIRAGGALHWAPQSVTLARRPGKAGGSQAFLRPKVLPPTPRPPNTMTLPERRPTVDKSLRRLSPPQILEAGVATSIVQTDKLRHAEENGATGSFLAHPSPMKVTASAQKGAPSPETYRTNRQTRRGALTPSSGPAARTPSRPAGSRRRLGWNSLRSTHAWMKLPAWGRGDSC